MATGEATKLSANEQHAPCAVRQLQESHLVQRLFDRDTPYKLHAQEFASYFESVDGVFQIVMDSEKRRQFSGVRNLLLDLEFLEQDVEKPRYWISPHHLTAFLDAKSNSPISPMELHAVLRAREKLGREPAIEL